MSVRNIASWFIRTLVPLKCRTQPGKKITKYKYTVGNVNPDIGYKNRTRKSVGKVKIKKLIFWERKTTAANSPYSGRSGCFERVWGRRRGWRFRGRWGRRRRRRRRRSAEYSSRRTACRCRMSRAPSATSLPSSPRTDPPLSSLHTPKNVNNNNNNKIIKKNNNNNSNNNFADEDPDL